MVWTATSEALTFSFQIGTRHIYKHLHVYMQPVAHFHLWSHDRLVVNIEIGQK